MDILLFMNKKYFALIATTSAFLFVAGGSFIAESMLTSHIESRIKNELPKSSEVSVSMPLIDMPRNLTSDSIKSAEINIGSYVLKGSEAESSIAIIANNISKSQPTLIGSLNITATIPASEIIKSANFDNAQIIGNTIQISVGSSGLGKALLVPKFSKNQIFFNLKSVSILGSEIPATSLPSDIQKEIKSKSLRTLSIPKGLKIYSASLSPKGLSINLRGSKIKFGNFGASL